MSLHASMSSEAKAKLEAQKRTSTIFSVIIAVLAMALIAALLYIITLVVEQKLTPEIISYGDPLGEQQETVEEVVEPEVTNTPTSPTASTTKVISALATSPTSVPNLTIENTEIDIDLGEELDFDIDLADTAEVSVTLTDFGASSRIPGTIGGYFYDFKQDRARKPVKSYLRDKNKGFVKRVQKLHRGKFASKALADSFKSDQELFLRYVVIPFTEAKEGPKYFGVEKLVKPSGWIAHYKGTVVAPKDGTFRFVGVGDDYLAVGVNGRPHLMAPWWSLRKDLVTSSVNSKSKEIQEGPFGVNSAERKRNSLLHGRWFKVKKGEEIEVDIAFGERPGGKMGYVLMIEEKGVKYKTQKGGAKILPPFTMGELNEDDLKRIRKFENDRSEAFKGWKFDLDNVPVFEAKL